MANEQHLIIVYLQIQVVGSDRTTEFITVNKCASYIMISYMFLIYDVNDSEKYSFAKLRLHLSDISQKRIEVSGNAC